jgi:hypothetical protein
MEAKAAGNPGAFTRRRGSFRERLAAFLPRMEPETNGRPAGANGRVNGAYHARKGAGAGERLDSYLRGSNAVALHHLRLPGNAREIDHLLVGPAGVTVVDSRHYLGGKAKYEGGRLRIGNRNRTDLIDEVLGQVDAVRSLLSDTPYADVPVEAAIAVGKVGGVPTVSSAEGRRVIVWGTGLIAREASRPGPLSRRRVDALASQLAGELSA